jgi:predicted Zn-dependent protease with MMP-like domain
MSRRHGPSVQELRDQAFELLDEDPDRAVALAREALRRQTDAESHYVLGVALCEAGASDEGIEQLQAAVRLEDEHVDAWVALAREQFDVCMFDEARVSVTAALRFDPLHPDALYQRACLRERRGDHDGAARDYQAAALSAPDEYPLPVPLDDAQIETVADEVVAQLHPSLQRYLQDVHILVDEVPPVDLLQQFDPPARPTEILGCFTGHSLGERATADAWSALPATIVLFRRNLSRIASDADELREELRVTLLHEIGHYLGLDEEDLAERGLD